ncbi:hypothetical protein DXG01_016939 [Tephrocybe rancida]|nr:hypothetical protein DXG01_016939 [Tephrocybe rancida]
MEPVVPPEITHELTQILSNLVLGDNEIRSRERLIWGYDSAEKAVNDRLAQTPELYLLALAQFAIMADTDVMRSFSLVLLRRLLFRPSPSSPPAPTPSSNTQPRPALYDHLSSQTITTLERLLLHSLQHEPNPKVRRNTVDTVSDVANQGMRRGRPWHALQGLVFQMAQVQTQGAEGTLGRSSAYGVFAAAPNLIMDLQAEAVMGVLSRGLADAESIEVRTAALRASVSYLESTDSPSLPLCAPLLPPMLSTLASLAHALGLGPPAPAGPHAGYHHLSVFLAILTPLGGTHPNLFAPHLGSLMQLMPPLVLPAVDCGPTPTVGRPFPTRTGSLPTPPSTATPSTNSSPNRAFAFPPVSSSGKEQEIDEEEEDLRQTLRLSALEFMLTISEARPGMVRRVQGWVEVGVRACLEAMGEMDDEAEGGLVGWLGDDLLRYRLPTCIIRAVPRPPRMRNGRALRVATSVPSADGGEKYIPSMLASYDWRVRHAGLMAIAAIGEGTGKVMLEQLGKVVDLVTPMFRDSHPRVRYAACQCVGQLCTDLEEVIQEKYHAQLFAVLIPTLEDPEPRVHSHAAAALINFCEGVARDTLLPYLDPIVERLLKLLNPSGDSGNVKRYVQEQAITTLAMVADASEVMFAKHYGSIMPLLLNVLRNADGPDYRKLRVKAMECAGLVAIAVGRDMFRPDAATLVELLIHIQKSPVDPADTQLGHYLIATWAKVCQAMGPEFEPYLHVVVPALLQTASAKPDVSVYDEDEEKAEDREGWETVVMEGQTLGIRTSAIEEKCQAFETLVIYCSTLGAKFAPYVLQSLEVTLPALSFYYHDGVREACAVLIPMLLAAGKASNTLTNQMVSAAFHHLITCVRAEHDASFTASLYKCINDCLRVVGGPSALPKEYTDGIVEVTKHQLQLLADRRKGRANRQAEGDKEEMALMEEVEDFVLEDMGKMLVVLDPAHPLLVAVSGVKDLGFNTWESEEEEE